MDKTTSNQSTGAEAMVRLLADHGVRHIFGLCGDTSLPFYDALARLDHPMQHILTRDERHAAYMADAYARLTGKVGICEGPSGGGATYIAPGLVEANESSVPILAITTDVATTSAGRFPLTELDQKALFAPLTKWNAVLDQPGALPRVVRRAFREMTTGRPGSAHLALPFDTQKAPVPEDEIWADERYGQFPAQRNEVGLDDAQIAEFVATLLNASNAVVVCGGGVVLSGAEAELQRLAESLNLPVATTVSGQGAIAETHANAVGVVGSNGGRAGTRAVVDGADVALFVGCRAGSVTTERWRSPAPGVDILHMDCDPAVIGASYPTRAAWIGDAKTCLEGLNEILREVDEMPNFNGAERAAEARRLKEVDFRPLADSVKRPIKPERVIDSLNRLLPPEAVVCADPGTPCPYFSAYWTIQQPGRHFISNRANGALGYALGASIGAAIARPDAKIVCATGDGSFGMCVGEFETITRYKLPITTIVFSNSVFGWIKAGQKSGFGERYFSVDFNRTDHAAVAAAYGVKSWRVDDPAELDGVLKQAIAHDGPTLVDVIAQPLQDAAAPVSEWVA
ncbi:MAG: thiamine pyrophosphate-binding protein [Pseudomonadota bacterium]